VVIFTVMNVRDANKARGQTPSDLVLSNITGPPRMRAPRHIEGRVIREEFHYPLEVVSIESIK